MFMLLITILFLRKLLIFFSVFEFPNNPYLTTNCFLPQIPCGKHSISLNMILCFLLYHISTRNSTNLDNFYFLLEY